MKNEKFSKFVLFLTQTTNYTFGTRIEIQFSIFSFWKEKYFSSNPVFNQKFEIQFTLNLKNKFPSEDTY